jgi:hypothetical protein
VVGLVVSEVRGVLGVLIGRTGRLVLIRFGLGCLLVVRRVSMPHSRLGAGVDRLHLTIASLSEGSSVQFLEPLGLSIETLLVSSILNVGLGHRRSLQQALLYLLFC